MIDQDRAREIALQAVDGFVAMPPGTPVTAERRDDRFVVTIGSGPPPGVRGADYQARITVDANSGEVLELLFGS